MQASTLSAALPAHVTQPHICILLMHTTGLPSWRLVTVIASWPLALNCNPTMFPSLCENAAEAVPSTPHSCLTNLSVLLQSCQHRPPPNTDPLCQYVYISLCQYIYTPTSIHKSDKPSIIIIINTLFYRFRVLVFYLVFYCFLYFYYTYKQCYE